MARAFSAVSVSRVGKGGDLAPKFDSKVSVLLEYDPQGLSIKLKRGKYFPFLNMVLGYCLDPSLGIGQD